VRSSDIFFVRVVTSTRSPDLLALADLVQEVVDLVLGRAQLDLGVDEVGRPDQLLGDDRRVAQLERRRASPRRRRAG
jgi:hypothetical protein